MIDGQRTKLVISCIMFEAECSREFLNCWGEKTNVQVLVRWLNLLVDHYSPQHPQIRSENHASIKGKTTGDAKLAYTRGE